MFKRQPQKSFRSGYLCSKQTQGEFGLLFHITMKQHSSPNAHLLKCQFEKDSTTILLSDLKRNLLRLNLNNLNYTPILVGKVSYFEFYSYDEANIYVASSQNQSKLYLVNTVNKKWQRFNLNINKIVAFEINMLRNSILVADPVILNVIDERTKTDTLTYRPPKSQTILKAIFTANNRSLLVLTSDMNIKQLNLQDLTEEFSVFLPFDPLQPHLAVSGNNRYFVVSGSGHQVVLITGISENEPVVNVLAFPFKIKTVKFDLENSLVVLGRDQVIYYYNMEENKLARLFNYQNQNVIHSFDISLDNENLCCISNFGTIFIYGLRDALLLLKERKELFQQRSVVVINKFQPGDEEQRPNNEDGNLDELAKQIPSESFYYPETGEEGGDYKEANESRARQSFAALKYKLQDNDFFKENSQQIVQIIYAFQKVLSCDSNSLILFFLRWIIKSQTIVKSLSLVLCPEVVTIVEKRFNLDFSDLVLKTTGSLFLDYFDEKSWVEIVKFLIRNKDSPQVLVVLFLVLLKSLLPEMSKCKTVSDFQILLKSNKPISLQELFQRTLQVSLDRKYSIIFKSIHEKEKGSQVKHSSKASSKSSKDRIKQLLQRQDQLQEDIEVLHTKKDHLRLQE